MSGTWAKLQTRRKLIKAFKSGGVFLGEIERPIFPKIHDVSLYDAATTVTFSIPNGLDPKTITKSEYVFRQYFGKETLIEGDYKLFKLTIAVQKSGEKISYDYSQILEIIQNERYQMPIVCGRDHNKQMRLYDAINNPNLLIFGQPGSGKSSILHVIHTTLIQYFSPDDLELYLADFKMSELAVYEGVRHVKSVSYLPKELSPVLKHLKKELEYRGKLLKKYRVRHMNKVPKAERRPAIVLTIDEFVMINDDNIMSDLLQIASLGRAYAIYVILSLQRPSHRILSTDVRGVISVRMGFRTVDRRNAIMGETPGSEKISKDEPGKFLLCLDELTELRAPYLSEDETEKILGAYKMDDWTNHNYRKSRGQNGRLKNPTQNFGEGVENFPQGGEELNESEVYYDAD